MKLVKTMLLVAGVLSAGLLPSATATSIWATASGFGQSDFDSSWASGGVSGGYISWGVFVVNGTASVSFTGSPGFYFGVDGSDGMSGGFYHDPSYYVQADVAASTYTTGTVNNWAEAHMDLSW